MCIRDRADADPVDPRGPVDVELVLQQGSGVHLDGDLRVLGHVKGPAHSQADVPDQLLSLIHILA